MKTLSPDQAPWLDLARAVLRGDYRKADGSTVRSLLIGLKGCPHPDAARAYLRLKPKKPVAKPAHGTAANLNPMKS